MIKNRSAAAGGAAVLFIGLVAGQIERSETVRASAVTRRPVAGTFALPLSFEVNQGQADAAVDFVSSGRGHSLKLSAAGLRWSPPRSQSGDPGSLDLRMTLASANRRSAARCAEDMPGKVNYLLGDDPARWRRNVPACAKVEYDGVYPGVNVVYYGNQQQLEYDFILAPGVDPNVIALEFAGAIGLEIDGAGSLVLRTADSVVELHKPSIYQQVGDIRKEIAGGYVFADNGQVSFRVGRHDPSRALVIDPVIAYSTLFGGMGGEAGRAIVLDKAGNAYVTGETSSTSIPGAASRHLAPAGSTDAFIAKISADGGRLDYVTYLGGHGADVGYSLAVDAGGSVYVTGDTSSRDFPLMKPLQSTLGGNADVFVAKLTPDGSQLVYSTYVGGKAGERGQGIAVDASGSAYVAGYTHSMDFPVANALQEAFAGGNADAFVFKLSPEGSTLAYSTYLGGGNDRPDIATGIAVDAAGNAYVTGFTNSRDFPTVHPVQPFRGPTDAFVSKLDPSGSALVYSTHLGGKADDEAMAIAVDASGSAYVTGHTESIDFPTTAHAFSTSCVAVAVAIPIGDICSGGDAFVAKLSPDGSALVYSTYVNARRFEVGRGIAVDAVGNAYVTGITGSSDLPVTNALQSTFGGADFDAFLLRVNPDGSALTYASYLGGSGNDQGYGVAVDAVGHAFVTGTTASRDFPTKRSSTLQGSSDAFVVKVDLSKAGSPTAAR
jgi:hypothetical protein